MNPRHNETNEKKNDEQLRREEKQRPFFRPAVEQLEERISPSGLGGIHGHHGHNHGGYA